jgi:hypothetical protein
LALVLVIALIRYLEILRVQTGFVGNIIAETIISLRSALKCYRATAAPTFHFGDETTPESPLACVVSDPVLSCNRRN